MSAGSPIDSLVEDLVADDPALGVQLGLTHDLAGLPSWSDEAVARRLAMLHRHQAALNSALRAGDVPEAVDAFVGLQIVRRYLRSLELLRSHRRSPGMYLDLVGGVYTLLSREVAPPDERIDAVRGRLLATPALLEEARANLEPGLPATAVHSGLEYAEGILGLAGETVRAFAREFGRPGALDDASRVACGAVEAFRVHLRDVLLPGASPGCAAGRAVIEDVLRWEHVLDDAPEDLAAYGREMLAQTQAAMAELAREMGHADAAAAVAAVAGRHPGVDDVVAAYAEAVAAARAYIVERDIVTLPPGEELRVIATPPFLRSILPFAAYDQPGPFMAEQVGFYYVTPPPEGLDGDELEEALRNHPYASLPTTGVHEGYPGHHLQLVSANLAPTLARRVAAIPDGGALPVEGWAFYCEEMMREQGFLSAPDVELMRLNDQVWRSCRVVIDVEMHLGLMDMQEAVAYMSESAHMNRREAVLECRRYAEEPGQAMSYLLGRREVLRLADLYRRAHPGSSLREFHDELLAWGSLAPAVVAWGMGIGPRPQAASAC